MACSPPALSWPHPRRICGYARSRPFHYNLEGNVEKAASLGSIVGTYKSLTTLAWLRHIEATNMERSGRFWQHNYYEHIIRDAGELEKIRQYIRNNPGKQYSTKQ